MTTNGGSRLGKKVAAIPVGSKAGITGILFDPAIGGVVNGVTQTIFASSYGNGVYESTNGGSTWTHLTGGPTDVEYAAVSSTGVYYAVGSGNTSLWKYANGTWTELLDNTQSIQSVAVDPSNPNEVVAETPGGGIDVSYNRSSTWSGWYNSNPISADIPWEQAANISLGGAGGTYMDAGGLAFNPRVANQIIVSAGTGVWNASVPTSGVPDSGNNFQLNFYDQSVGIENLVANEILVPPGGDPVLASWDRPFFQITNPNAYPSTYGPADSDNIVAGWSVDYASSTPSFLVGLADWWGTEESGYSTNGGQTWTNFPTEIPGADSAFMGGTIAASTPQNIVWAPADSNQPYYTLNGGATWSPIKLPGVTSWSGFDYAYYFDTRTVTADRVLSNTFYLYYPGQGVFETTNGGSSWTNVHPGYIESNSSLAGYNSQIMSLPGEAGNLFYTSGPQGTISSTPANSPFYRSTNGGATWTTIPNVLDVFCFGFGAAAPGQSYPAVYIVGYVGNVYGVWQSTNNAQSWTNIGTYPTGELDQIKTISGNPNVFGDVYVGFAGGGYAYLPAKETTIATNGTTTLAQVGNLFELNPASGGTGPFLKLNGSVVAAGQFALGWTPVGAIQTGNGYEVAWSVPGANEYVLWNTDSNGDYTSNATGILAGTSAELEAVEANFGETFPGNCQAAGSRPTQIGNNGALAEVGNTLFELNPAGGGPLLELNGGVVTAGQFAAGWTPVGAIQTGDGYEVAWSAPVPNQPGQNQYVVWNTDSNGDYTSNATGILSGASAELEAVEANFGETFPGAGPRAATNSIGNNGALAEVGNTLFELNPAGGGPLLELNGGVVTAGQFAAGWTPVGATQRGNGYEVAWSVPGANEYELWNVDGDGEFTGAATGILSGASAELEGVEANFGETFAGAGTPATPTPIGTDGQLAQVGNLFELNPSGGGPLLELGGSVVTAGQFQAGWTPVGAIQTGDGYEVAWNTPTGLYTVWDTDAEGNFVSDPIGSVSGSSFALEDLEPSFHQDLNGDGQLSTQLITAPTGPGDTVDLTSQTQATINLGENDTASASGGLNAPSLTIVGTPDAITLGSGADMVEYSLARGSGIETIANFTLGQDMLNIDLNGAPPDALQAYDAMIGGLPAVAIASTADSAHGVVLTGVSSSLTAADLLANHTAFSSGHAVIT